MRCVSVISLPSATNGWYTLDMTHVRNLNDDTLLEVPAGKLKFRISAYGVLTEDGKVLIQIQPKNPDKYNLPGGALEKGEKLHEALVREYKEETGIEIAPSGLLAIREDFVTFPPDTNFYQSILIFYRVRQIGGTLGKFDGKEGDSIEAKFVNVDDELENKLQDIFKGILVSTKA